MPTTKKTRLDSLPRGEAAFIEVMECLAVPKLPDGSQWVYEIKLDGYRDIAVKSDGKLNLFQDEIALDAQLRRLKPNLHPRV